MRIMLCDSIIAEGNPEELALYSVLFFAGMKTAQQMGEEQEVADGMKELFRTIDESIRKKRGEQKT